MLVGRVGQFTQGTARNGNPAPGQPAGKWRYWSFDAFAQDAWKLRSNLTLEYGVRFGYWTNNKELNGLGGYFTPDLYNPNAGSFLDPGTYQRLNGVCYVYTGCAPDGILDNRSPFALPRVNVAWDIDGEGNNVLRGGFGMFYNRNMGNVEYDNTLRMPPNSYQVATDFWAGGGYGGGAGLTYDTISEATFASRIGSIGINSLTPDSFVWPKTNSYSISYARRIPWNQVVEAAYVGTHGYDLVSRSNGNVMPYGSMATGTFNGVDMSVPVNRVSVASDNANLAAFRPYNALNRITQYNFRGESNYDSLQVTLSRQTSRNLQYFVAYTYGKTQGHPRRRIRVDRPLRCHAHLRRDRPGSHPHPEHLLERLRTRRRTWGDGQLVRPRAVERLAAVRDHVVGQRRSVQAQLQRRGWVELGGGGVLRHGRRRRSGAQWRQWPRPRLHVRPHARRQGRGREAPRHQLHRVRRRSARTAS